MTNKATKAIILASVPIETYKKDAWLKITTFGLEKYCEHRDLYILQRCTIVEPSIKGYQKQFMTTIKLIKQQSEPIVLVVDELKHIPLSQKVLSVLDELIRADKLELHCCSESYVIGDQSSPQDLIV